MVRTYKRKKEPIDESKIKGAVLSVKRDGMSVRAAAKLYGVKNSTLQDWLKNTTEEQAQSGDVKVVGIGRKTVSD